MKIAIAHDGRGVHRGAGRMRSTVCACRPAYAASSTSLRCARRSFGHRHSGAPADTRILATARCPTLSIRIPDRTRAVPAVLTRRQRQRVGITRGVRAALCQEAGDTAGFAVTGCVPPHRGIRDRPARHGAATPRPGSIRPAASLRRCNERAVRLRSMCHAGAARRTRLPTNETRCPAFSGDFGENRGQWAAPILQKSSICH